MAHSIVRSCSNRLACVLFNSDVFRGSWNTLVNFQSSQFSSDRSAGRGNTQLLQPIRVKNVNTKRTEALASRSSGRSPRNRGEKPWRNATRSRFQQEMDLVDDQVYSETLAVENSVNRPQSPMETKEHFFRNLVSASKKIRFKTLEKKYFKKEKSLNLLSWRAKAQIRFLNQEDPETWTVQTLADSFPVSEESIVKILKSRIRLHRPEHIENHDSDVQRNWIRVRDSLVVANNTCPEMLYEGFFNSDNESVIMNADGCLDLPVPFPVKKDYHVKGPFSDIVKDCLDSCTVSGSSDVDSLRGLIPSSETKTLMKVLNEVSDILVNKSFTPPQSVESRGSRTANARRESVHLVHQMDSYKKGSAQVPVSLTGSSIMVSQKQSKPKTVTTQDSLKKNLVQGTVYQDGDSMYDENGDFLYRIP